MDCSAQGLATNSKNLVGSLTYKQLLAALLYVQCTANGMNCTAQSLSTASACLYNCLTEKQLLAALVYVQCTNNGGGGGGGGASQIVEYTANPNTEVLTPPNVNSAAVAVSPGKQIYTWTIPAGPWV